MSLFELGERLTVWKSGLPIAGWDDTVWRQDEFGNVIKYDQYGDRSAEFGWEIDHRHPTALGGLNSLLNKRPLHWKANAGLGGFLSGLLNS